MTVTRETREGWPLPTVESEVNGDSKSTNERGPSLVGSLGCCAGYRDLSCLGCSRRPSTKYFSLPYTFSFRLSPLPSKLNIHSCWVACLLVCVSDCDGEAAKKMLTQSQKALFDRCLWTQLHFKTLTKMYFPDEGSCLLHNR